MHKKLCFCIFFFVINLEKYQKFRYVGVFFARIKIPQFVLAKNFAEINFHEITQNSKNSRKSLPAKIISFKVHAFYIRNTYEQRQLSNSLRLNFHYFPSTLSSKNNGRYPKTCAKTSTSVDEGEAKNEKQITKMRHKQKL